MGDITQGIDSYFWLTLAGIICGSMSMLIRFAYRSKCKKCEICCIKIERDTEIEKEEDMMTPNIVSNKGQSIDGNETMSRV